MGTTILQTFQTGPRTPSGLTLTPEQVAAVREVIASKDTTLSRARAVDLLQASNLPDRVGDFRALLQSESESQRIRYIAANSLAESVHPRH